MFNFLSCALFLNAQHVYAIILAGNYTSIRNPAATQWTHYQTQTTLVHVLHSLQKPFYVAAAALRLQQADQIVA